jgi:hypothetical protein
VWGREAGVRLLDSYLFIYAGLLLLDLLLQGFELYRVRSRAVGLENLDVPNVISFATLEPSQAYSAESGVIFFSSISSSAYVFLNFSQSWPLAPGMLGERLKRTAAATRGILQARWKWAEAEQEMGGSFWRGREALIKGQRWEGERDGEEQWNQVESSTQFVSGAAFRGASNFNGRALNTSRPSTNT